MTAFVALDVYAFYPTVQCATIEVASKASIEPFYTNAIASARAAERVPTEPSRMGQMHLYRSIGPEQKDSL